MGNRVLYTLNVSWSWIEQRPHIFANQLVDWYRTVCVSPRSLVKTILGKDQPLSSFRGESRHCYYLPKVINKGVLREAIAEINKRRCYGDINEFDCVWFSHPYQVQFLPDSYKGIVVYDCMDDHGAMVSRNERESLLRMEEELIGRADIVFASSSSIFDKIGLNKSVLVRNGYKQGNLRPVTGAVDQPSHTIAYFGTVAQWFDFDAISAVVENCGNISFRIVGPTEVQRDIERVEYRGPVVHQELFGSISDCSCLIMPFKVNDIIKAVDPVKLYEYIAFGKCVISVRYPEVERFGDYVYFYESADELVELINDLVDKGFPPKYTEESRTAFLRSNTWESRAETIVATLAEHGITPR